MRTAIVMVVGLGLVGCGTVREPGLGEGCPDWEKDIKAVAQADCTSCHGATLAEGAYRADSYQAAVHARADGTPRVVPGDVEGSLLIRAASGGLSAHPALDASKLHLLSLWVECRVPGRHDLFHPRGWTNPGDRENFHGVELRKAAYQTTACQKCHGDDLKGGKAGVSCTSCHAKGPDDCSTCHGDATSSAPPRSVEGLTATTAIQVGAHRVHLQDSAIKKAFDCDACHVKPKLPGDEGHYQVGGKLDDFPAEVTFSPAKAGDPHWDRATATCESAACHAPSVDSNAKRQEPRWTSVGQGDADCGTCHGLPPSSHFDSRCEGCHAQVYADGGIIAPQLHVNGKVELGNGASDCSACHGDATSSAPPRDVSGHTNPALVTVGAHRAHLTAHTFRGPLACEECHRVPKAVGDQGHIDSAPPAEVFPEVDGVGVLARHDNARASWEHASATCASVYCHGGGARLARDATATVVRAPLWTGGASQVFCGSCHGLPPKDGFHIPTLGVGDCIQCHAATMAADGGLVFSPNVDGGSPVTTHLDGKVQVGATP